MMEPQDTNPLHASHLNNVAVSDPDVEGLTPQAFGSRRYMSKSQRACDFCRSRKTACRITNSPPCRLCSQHGRTCTFNKRTAQRQTRAAMSSETQPMSGVQLGTQSLFGPSTSLSQNTPLDHTISAAQDHNQSNGAINNEALRGSTWSPDALLNDFSNDQLEDILGAPGDINMNMNTVPNLPGGILDSILRNEAYPLDDHTLRHHVGPTGEQDPNLLRRYRFNDHNEFWFKKLGTRMTLQGPSPVLWMLSLSEQTSLKPDEATPQHPIDNERELLERLVPPNIGNRIIALFYKFICPQFPLLSYDNPPSTSESPTYLLAAIYLLASQFFSYDEYLCIEVVYNKPSTQALWDIAWGSFKQNLHASSISMVQTALILLLSSPEDTFDLNIPLKWSLLGITVSLAQTIGLNLDAKSWEVPVAQLRLRRRLSWMVYTLDTWFAFYLGRPTHISHDNWMIISLNEEDLDMDDSVQVNSSSLALQFSGLTNILKSILQKLFTVRATENLATDFRRTLETARPLLVELSTWHKSLSQGTQSQVNGKQAAEGDQAGPLKLSYLAAQSAIFRALLRAFDNPEITSYLVESEMAEFDEARSHCRGATRTYAEASLQFISSLNSKYFEQFWPPWTSTCFAYTPAMTLLLVCTSSNQNEAAECKTLLTNIRDTLRIQSRAYDTMKLAVLRTDGHFWIGINNVLNMHPKLGDV